MDMSIHNVMTHIITSGKIDGIFMTSHELYYFLRKIFPKDTETPYPEKLGAYLTAAGYYKQNLIDEYKYSNGAYPKTCNIWRFKFIDDKWHSLAKQYVDAKKLFICDKNKFINENDKDDSNSEVVNEWMKKRIENDSLLKICNYD